MDDYSRGTGRGDVSPSIIGMGLQWDCLRKICGICKHVERVALCLRFLLHGGTYSQDLSGPVGGAGKVTWRGEERRGRKEKERGG